MAALRKPQPPSPEVGTGLGEWIRERRSSQGVSQRELADRASMSRSYLCDLERGRGKQPSTQKLHAIARALGEDHEEIFRQAGLIQRQPDRGDGERERKMLAVFRALTTAGQNAIESYARYVHHAEQAWVQPSLVNGDDPEHTPQRPTQSGPTLFD